MQNEAMNLFTSVILAFPFLRASEGLVISRLATICKDEDYLTPPQGPVICCAGNKLTPGISYEKYWSQCATPVESETTIDITLWRVYECIVKKHLELNNKTLTLENFARIMSKNYPQDIRTKIFDNMCSHFELAYEDAEDLELLKEIRKRYYHIELLACSSKNAAVYQKKMKEFPIYEKIYMRGGRCLGSQIPIDPSFNLMADDQVAVSTWKTLLETLSDNDEKYYGAEIHRACELFSNWIGLEVATADELFSRPNFRKLFDRVKPTWANKNVSDLLSKEIDEYWREALSAHIEPPEQGFKSKRRMLEDHVIKEAEKFFDTRLIKEFRGLRDETKARIMMVNCMVPTFMKVSISESFTYLLCRRQETKAVVA